MQSLLLTRPARQFACGVALLTMSPKSSQCSFSNPEFSVKYLTISEPTHSQQDARKSKCPQNDNMFWKFANMAFRLGYVFGVFFPTIANIPILYSEEVSEIDTWWNMLRESIVSSGPCAIKFCQWAASRPDLFPAIICNRLEDLQSRTQTHSNSNTIENLKRSFGPTWHHRIRMCVDINGIFVSIGSGCVAEVLQGVLTLENNRAVPVAIKIVHSGIRDSILADMDLMRLGAWLIECLPGFESFSVQDSVEEFSSLMCSQLDMTVEARNLVKFRHNFNCVSTLAEPPVVSLSLLETILQETKYMLGVLRSKVQPSHTVNITFPEPIFPYVTRDCLVETLEHGVPMAAKCAQLESARAQRREGAIRSDQSDRDNRDKANYRDRRSGQLLAAAGLQCILKMIFVDNFIHADLHPGNILWRNANKHNTSDVLGAAGPVQHELCMLDAGLVVEMSPQDRYNFVELFQAVVLNNGYKAGSVMIHKSRSRNVIDAEGFMHKMDQLVSKVHEEGMELGKFSIGALMQDVLRLCHAHQVKLESRYATVAIAMGVLEGLGRRLDPKVDILGHAAPYVLGVTLVEAVQIATKKLQGQELTTETDKS